MSSKKPKYIFVVGGVMSGIGKGITSASIGVVLSNYGYKVNIMKIDPYLNVDAGTMNPTEHGEVFVMSSGLETDQDMGNYERFLNIDLLDEDYLTSGMVYKTVIDKEREFKYKGKCVESMIQVIEEIKKRIETSAKKSKADVQIIEIGGTLGDHQNFLFLETARQMNLNQPEDIVVVLVTYFPVPSVIGEMKTRPAQSSVRDLNSFGFQPTILLARSSEYIDKKHKKKIAHACNLSMESIIPAPDVESIYDIPINLEKENISKILIKDLNLKSKKKTRLLAKWAIFANNIKNNKRKPVRIAIIGKYFESGSFILSDSYISILEALKFSSIKIDVRVEIDWLQSANFEGERIEEKLKTLKEYDGILIPGGYGSRGITGKLNVLKYTRKNNIPTLGICYGMQLMVVEFARNVLRKRTAHSIEVDPNTLHPVITFIEGMKEKLREKRYGGTMRLGSYTAKIEKGTLLRKLYGKPSLTERHRHRYEINNEYINACEEKGLIFSAYSKNGLAEAIELEEHPFYLGTQFHPEFTARVFEPNPVFNGFVAAAKEKRYGKKNK